MEIFISWSGKRSKKVAHSLSEWIESLFPLSNPWISTGDIPVGSVWASEMQEQLTKSKFGIICLTSENLSSTWLHYEAGALATKLEPSRVCPLLIDIKAEDLREPFKWFQSVEANRDGVWKLANEINNFSEENRVAQRWLKKAFKHWWQDLEPGLAPPSIEGEDELKQAESVEDIVTDVRDLVREILVHLGPRYTGFEAAIDFLSTNIPSETDEESERDLIQQASREFGLPVHIARTALIKARTSLALARQKQTEGEDG